MVRLSSKDFMKECNLEDHTMTESDFQRVYTTSILPRDSIMSTDKAFVSFDIGQTGGTHWTRFYKKYNKSFCFGSFCGQLDEVLLQQSPKPLNCQNY